MTTHPTGTVKRSDATDSAKRNGSRKGISRNDVTAGAARTSDMGNSESGGGSEGKMLGT